MRSLLSITSIQLLVIFSLACKTYGQETLATGGRALGMAGSSIVLVDEFGLFNNPGAIDANNLSILASYNTQYFHLGINDARLGFVTPVSRFKAGLGVTYFGDDLFNQIKVSTVFADKFGFARTGFKVSYHQYHVQNYGYRSAITIDIGGVFTLSEQVDLAIVFQNLTRSKLMGESDDPLNSLMKVAFSYQPVNSFRIDTQIYKSINSEPGFQLGIEYLLSQFIALRTGFSPSQSIAAFGLGLNWDSFKLDLAGQYNHNIGYSGIISALITRKAK